MEMETQASAIVASPPAALNTRTRVDKKVYYNDDEVEHARPYTTSLEAKFRTTRDYTTQTNARSCTPPGWNENSYATRHE